MGITTDYQAAIIANFDGDVHSGRFVEISRFEDNSEICVRQITEESISQAIDMADCLPDFHLRKWLYVDDTGEFKPVTIGTQERFSSGVEQPFRYATSALIAGGKCVGEVVYTDH